MKREIKFRGNYYRGGCVKAIFMSIRPEHLVNILNGKKTLELRKSIPKDFKGWVYLYCTKAKPYIDKKTLLTVNVASFNGEQDLNGFVVARFWFDDYIEIKMEEEYVSNWLTPYVYRYNVPQELLNKMCLTNKQLEDYSPDIKGNDIYDMKLPTLYAWHIKNLEIFDKPMELRDFSKWVRKTIYSGTDCPPYVDEVLASVSRAPQSWQYVEVE